MAHSISYPAKLRGVWRALGAAPHRMMFLPGVMQLAAVMAWWLVELIGRYTGLWAAPATTVPAVWVHPFLMVYGFFPFFIFGFLLTTYPRWLGGDPVPAPRVSLACSLFVADVAGGGPLSQMRQRAMSNYFVKSIG